MADPFDIALNLVGWMVAGLVTLVGVWIAHRREERSREKHEDRTRVLEPLRGEMVAIAGKEHTIKAGGWGLWSRAHASEEYTRIVTSGLLQDRRHDRLRRDIEELHRLEEEYGEKWSAFAHARRTAIADVLEGAKAFPKSAEAQAGGGRGEGVFVSREGLLERHLDDTDLLESLSAEDPERWVQRFAAMYQDFEPDPRSLYDQATTKVSKSRDAHQKAAKALLEFAARIRMGIDLAFHEGKPYGGKTRRRKR